MFSICLKLVAAALFASLFTSAFGQSCNAFRDPPAHYRAKFRYWLPDASVSADIVSKDIHDARAAGAGGVEFLPYYLYGSGEETFDRAKLQNPDQFTPKLPSWSKYGFGTAAFNSIFKSSLKATREVGAEMDYALGPNQGAGVPSEVGVTGLAVQLLMGNTTLLPYETFSGPVPEARWPDEIIMSGLQFMHPLHDYNNPNLTALIAYKISGKTSSNTTSGERIVLLQEGSFVDLMPLITEGFLQWTPPDVTESWKIFSFWEAYTNQRSCDGGPNATDVIGNGSWIVDHFSAAGAAKITDFWDENILSDTEIADLLSSVGNYGWEDSMEMVAALYWTPGLLDRFKQAYDFEFQPYLPFLFDKNNIWNSLAPPYSSESYCLGNGTCEGVSKYQLNYRTILNDGYQKYLTHLRNWTRSISTNGFSTQPAYNLPLSMSSDISLLDAPEAESLGFQQLTDAYRQFSGPAHLANISVISTELGAVNIPPYSLLMTDLLQQIKRSFAGGFTMNVIHGFPASVPYINTTWPGYTAFFYRYTEMWNQIQPAWDHMQENLDYVGRNQWILQQGSPRIDLAFYSYKSPWAPTIEYKSTNLADLGFTYEYLGPDNLTSDHVYIVNNTLGIPAYKALIINNQTVISVEAAEVLVKMASSGLPIIIIGSPPTQVVPVDSSRQSKLNTAIKDLLSSKTVYKAATIDEIPGLLADRRILPRVALNCSSNPVLPVQRSTEHVEYVFLFNDQAKDVSCTATIEDPRMVPYVYSAWTGVQSRLSIYTYTNSSLSIPLTLRANETTILAFERSSAPRSTSFQISGALHSIMSDPNRNIAVVTGKTKIICSNGRTLQVDPPLPAPTNLSTWNLTVEDWNSAPDRYSVQTEITNHTFTDISLVAWNQIHTSLQPVGGIGHYTARFTTPMSVNSTLLGILKLPLIQHTARAYLDGNQLQPVDPVNPIIDLGALETGKEYELRVDISTTLFNRIKTDRNEIRFLGQSVDALQPLYRTLPFQENGMIGSVMIEWGTSVEVHCLAEDITVQ